MTPADAPVGTRTRWRLLLIGVAFAAPMLAAYLLYFGGWRPQAAHPYGELVTPPRPVADVELSRLDGQRIRLSQFQRRWLLLYFGSSECPPECARALYKIRQVIVAQGRNAMRVQAAMVVTDARAFDMLRFQLKLKDYPDMTALVGSSATVAKLAHEFDLSAGEVLAPRHRIYLVDPLGNFMMSYSVDADANGMRKDLARLLRASQVG